MDSPAHRTHRTTLLWAAIALAIVIGTAAILLQLDRSKPQATPPNHTITLTPPTQTETTTETVTESVTVTPTNQSGAITITPPRPGDKCDDEGSRNWNAPNEMLDCIGGVWRTATP